MSQSSQSPSGAGPSPAALRSQFEAEVLAADLHVPEQDRERLFAMWVEHLPMRDSLRSAAIAPEEEPSFTQKPAQAGAGIGVQTGRQRDPDGRAGGAS